MRIIPILIAFLFTCVAGNCQGTLQFYTHLTGQNVFPPNESPFEGHGGFSLIGNSLSGSVVFRNPPRLETGYIRGPASAGEVGEVIFDLGQAQDVSPNPPQDPYGYGWYYSEFILQQEQISQLVSGRWYVEVDYSSAYYPAGRVRGQILLVPEPSTWILLLMSCVILARKISNGPRRDHRA